MKTDSSFLDTEPAPRVPVWFNGTRLELPLGANLAAALLAAGVVVMRETPALGAPRGPFCMMGACFDCLITLQGVTRQACMTEVAEGMHITSPHHKNPQRKEAGDDRV